MTKRYITWKELEQLTYKLGDIITEEINKWRRHLNCLIALSRGGLVSSRILADYIGFRRIYCVGAEHYNGLKQKNNSVEGVCKDPGVLFYQFPHELFHKKNILILDDVADSGLSLKHTVSLFKNLPECIPAKIYTATIHYKPKSCFKPDFYAKEVPNDCWLVYPYERNENKKSFNEKNISFQKGEIPQSGMKPYEIQEDVRCWKFQS